MFGVFGAPLLMAQGGIVAPVQGADDKLGQTLWTHSKQ
jgi:hypothetical protein